MPKLYTVKTGDNLSKIARAHNLSVEELKEINGMAGIENPVIHPGDILKLSYEEAQTNHGEKVLAQNGNTTKAGNGGCPLRQTISLFPVRYAIDESPNSAANKQGPSPIPNDWIPQNTHPTLTTRSYTFRQLRDGWLYIWNQTTKQLYEYQIQGAQFTLLSKTDQQGKAKQPTKTEAGTKKYLEFTSDSHLYLSYSPIQCTDRVKKHLTQHTGNWVREVNLAELCLGGLPPNTHSLEGISRYVADITGSRNTHGDFSSTLLPINSVPSHQQYKPTITEDSIKAAVPEVKDAFFVAIEDPLAIVDDLTMQLIGRWAEKAAFTEQNEHKITIGNNCLDLLGTKELTADMPADIKKDPVKYYQCMADTNQYYNDIHKVDTDESQSGEFYEGTLLANMLFGTREDIQQSFRTKWKFLPSDTNKSAWLSSNRTLLIDDLKFQDMLNFLASTVQTQISLDQHIKNSEADLRIWLNLFNEDILQISYDNLKDQQSQQLLEITDTIISFLNMSQEGKQWISEQCGNPKTVFALATANFDKPLYQCIQTIAQQLEQAIKNNEQQQTPSYANDQWLIDNIANNNNLGTLRYLTASNSTSVVSRMGEIQSAIDMVKDSESYKKLTEASKQALAIQRSLSASSDAHATMQHLEHNIVSAVSKDSNQTLTQSLLSSARQDQVNGTTINIGKNPDHAWQKKEITRLRRNINQQLYYRRMRIRKADAGLLTLKPGVKERYLAEIEQLLLQRTKLNIHKAPALFVEVQTPTLAQQDIKQHAELADLLCEPTKAPHSGASSAMPPSATSSVVNKWFAQRQAEFSTWVNNKGGYLPIIVLGFNLYNLKAVTEQAAKNNYDANAKRELLSAAGYTANAFTALYVIPYWNRYASEPVREGGKRIMQTSISEWAAAKQVTKAAIATRLASSMAIFSAFAFIGASVELYQVYNNDYSNATSSEEQILLRFKMGALGLMSLTAGAQFIGAALAPWYAFGWILSTPVGIAIAVVGVLYLIFSFWAAYYKREGLRLWFYRCSWGRIDPPYWQDTPAGHQSELHALYKLLLQPSLTVQRANTFRDRIGFYPLSMWVAIQLPRTIEGNSLTLDSLLVNGRTTPPSRVTTAHLDYSQWIANGHWIAIPPQGSELILPSINGPDRAGPTTDISYTSNDNSRIWLTKLVYNSAIQQAAQSNDELMIELKITYPDSVFGKPQPDQDNSYTFTIALNSTSNAQGTLQTDYYSTTPSTKTIIDKLVDNQRLQLLEVASVDVEEQEDNNPQGNPL